MAVTESLTYEFDDEGLDELRRDMKKLSSDIEETGDQFERLESQGKDSAQGIERSLDDIDANSALAAIEQLESALEGVDDKLDRLDGRAIDIDTDVDEERVSGGGTGGRRRGGRMNLPGELDEVAEFGSMLLSLSPRVKAALAGLVGAGVAGSAALGAAGGLAAVATSLANELGPEGLQSRVKALSSEYKRTGREFASAFDDVITGIILPAGRGFAQAIRGVDEALANFSGMVLANLDKISGPLGIIAGATQAAINAGSGETSNASAVVEGTGKIPGTRKITTQLANQIERVRDKFERDLIPKEEMLTQIVSFRKEAFTNLQKLEQEVPGALPSGVLDSFGQSIRKVQKRLEKVKNTISSEEFDKIVGEAENRSGIRGSAVEGAGLQRFTTSVPGQQGNLFSKSLKRVRRLRGEIKKIRPQLNKTLRGTAIKGLRRMNRQLGWSVAQLFTLGNSVDSLGDVFKAFGQIAKRVLQQLIAQLTQAAFKALFLKIVTGIFSGGASIPAGGVGIVSPGISGSGILSSGAGGVSGTPQVAQSGSASIIGGSINIPVEVINQANRQGEQANRRQGR
ncbi:hypothetical protein OSG_eHP25_00005 [environmental Halophage eHP-25]|nr:hypothetical protein OSG_eHP25_00005 [environmental Halophage eHP-25]